MTTTDASPTPEPAEKAVRTILLGEKSLEEIELAKVLQDKEGYIQVEYDKEYFGGDYSKVGDMALVPLKTIKLHNGEVETAFQASTGIDKIHIISFNPDEVVDANGDPLDI